MKDLVTSLQKTGLSEKESLVYLTLLKYGTASVSTISRNAGIKRPTTYVILDELWKKSLVIEVPDSKKTIYQAKSPDDFYDMQKRKFNSFKESLPELRSVYSDRHDIKTLHFEGDEGLEEALFYKIDQLENSEVFGFWAATKDLPQKSLDISYKWNEELRKRNIALKGFTPEDEGTKGFKEKYNSLIELMPGTIYSSEASIDITDLFIRITDLHKKTVVIVENPRLAKTVRAIFDLAGEAIKAKK